MSRRLLAPGLDAPDISAIEDFVKAPEDSPRRLQGLITTDLPTAADWPYGIVFDLTTAAPKVSDGTTWNAVSTPLGAGLTALEAFNTNGFLVQTANDTFAGRTLTAPAAGFTITNPAGTAGNPTFVLADDLNGLEGLAANGMAARTGTSTWAVRTLTAPAAGMTVTNGDGVAGNPTLVLANDLAALEALAGTNTIYYRSATDTWTAVTINATLSFTAGALSIDLTHANNWTGTQSNSNGWVSTGTGNGYATGAGGTVTQITNKATGVTLDKACGDITMNGATLNAATTVAFGLTCNKMASGDMVHVQLKNGVGTTSDYLVWAVGCVSGGTTVYVRNIGASNLSEAIVVRFTVIKGVTA